MKKILVAIYLLILGVLLSACSACEAADFISFDVDGDHPFRFTIFNAYSTENRLQRRVSVGDGTQIWAELIEIQNGDVILIDHLSPFYGNVDVTNRPPIFHDAILIGPIEIGTSWVRNPTDPPHIHDQREITGVDISITTPAGTFNTIEVTTFPPHNPDYFIQPRTKDFFARDLGVVKSVVYSGITLDQMASGVEQETIITLRLIDIQRTGLLESALVFYFENDEWLFSEIEVLYSTNNDLNQVFEEILRLTLEKAFGHTSQAAINFAILNHDTHGLNLDLNAAFLAEMAQAANEAHELNTINAIVMAFGVVFDAAAVRITVDGQPYSGPYITLGAAEFIPRGRGIWD